MPIEYLRPLDTEKVEFVRPLEEEPRVKLVRPIDKKDTERVEPTFQTEHPNLYSIGMAGIETLQRTSALGVLFPEQRERIKERAKDLTKISWARYLHEDERDKFKKLDQQHQVRQLLLDDLEFAVMGRWNAITKDAKYAVSVLKNSFPKTFTAISKVLEADILNRKKSLIKPKTEGAANVEQMYDEASDAVEIAKKTKSPNIYETMKKRGIDVSGNVKKELSKQGELGREAIMRHDLISGANSKAVQQINNYSSEIYDDLSRNEIEYLNRVIQSRRTIAIEKYKDIKHPKGLGMKEHTEWLESLPGETSKKLNERADNYFKVMRDQLDELYNEGIISGESYESLKASGDYSPRRFLQHIDNEKTYTFGGKKITVTDSGIKALQEGSEQFLEKDSRLLLSQVVSRTQNRIFRNRANKAMYNLAKESPDNGIVKILKKGEKKPNDYETISVIMDGEKKQLVMPSGLAEEWVMRDPAIDAQLANFLGWMFGGKILRPMATGINPEFALTNFPRDVAHIWLSTHEYSPTLPKAFAQISRDLVSILPDVIRRKGKWVDYINEGGGMEFLTHQGQTRSFEGSINSIQKALGWFGETSEIATRLALRERAIRNGKTPEEATWIARNYLDFSQGGNWAKAVDSAVPYLNASIQGTRGIFRSASEKPAEFGYKVGQIGTLAMGLYMANKNMNPDAWSSISDREKVNNWIITTPFSYTDDKNDKHHIYFKIAKDQGQRIIATIFESMIAKYSGEDVNVDMISAAAEDAIPILPTQTLPPSLEAILGYELNKDIWRNQDIWKGPRVETKEEYTDRTHPAFVKYGELTGMSPERTRYALSQFFTSGNVYTSVVGYGWNKLMEDMPETEKEKITEELILNQPFIRRIANETSPYSQYAKEIRDAELEISTKNFKENRDFYQLSDEIYNGLRPKKDMNLFLKDIPVEKRKQLRRTFYRFEKFKELPEKTFWMKLSNLNPEARAVVFWNRYRNADEEDRKFLDKYKYRIPGITTKRFNKKLSELTRRQGE